MRYILILLVMLSSSQADIMIKKTLACPTIMKLQNSPKDTVDNYLKISMYAIANDCIILNKRDKIEAISYDSINSKEIFQKIIYKKTGVYLYILRSTIQIEQAGKKSSYRF